MAKRPKRKNKNAPWTAEELRAWLPPENLTVSEWAEKYRLISALDAAEPGVWRNKRAPYLVEIQDSYADPDVDIVVLMKAARVGGSESTRNFLGYTIDQDPSPCLIVYPSEASAKEQITNEITPMLTSSPRLKRQLTENKRDIKKSVIETKRCRIYIGWSGSANSLSARTIRVCVIDECDKFPVFSGRDAGPIQLAMRRTQTFGHRKSVIIMSTPTTADGAIATEFKRCIDRRYYHVPCPHCGVLQALTWAQLKWPKGAEDEDQFELASRVEAQQAAWYECAHCDGRIEEVQKRNMVKEGVWVSEGFEVGEHPTSRRRGYQISALYSLLGVTWSDIAAQWIASKGDLAARMEFVNQTLGEPYEKQSEAVKSSSLKKKIEISKENPEGRPRCVCPRWTGIVLATVDTQKDHFWYTIHAWGAKNQTRVLDYGKATDFKDLRAKTVDRVFPIDGWERATATVTALYIDAGGGARADSGGSRTDEVYRFCRRDPGRIIPVRGHGGTRRASRPVRTTSFDYKSTRGGSSYRVSKLFFIDTEYFKDILAARLNQYPKDDELELWQLPDDVCDTYFRHHTAEHKILIRKGNRRFERWTKRSHGRRNDLLDCSVYQLAAAYIHRVEELPTQEELDAIRSGKMPKRTEVDRKFSHPYRKTWLANRRRTR